VYILRFWSATVEPGKTDFRDSCTGFAEAKNYPKINGKIVGKEDKCQWQRNM